MELSKKTIVWKQHEQPEDKLERTEKHVFFVVVVIFLMILQFRPALFNYFINYPTDAK